MIDGVRVKDLKVNTDNRGRLMEILRRDDPEFIEFGQIYITTAFTKVIKAWHYHKLQTDNFTCVKGKIRLALYDAREGSGTKGEINEFLLSLDEPKLVQIPKGVYHGFKCVSKDEAIIINTVTHPYNCSKPDEYRIDEFDNNINYDWNK